MSQPDLIIHDEKDNVGVVVIETTKKGQECSAWIMENDKTIKVNSTNEIQKLKIIETTLTKNKQTVLDILPGGIKSFKRISSKNDEITKIIIKSKLYMARPIVFKYMETSFDVFHG